MCTKTQNTQTASGQAFCKQAGIHFQKARKATRNGIEKLVQITSRNPRTVVYGFIGSLVGGVIGGSATLLLGVAGAVWGCWESNKPADTKSNPHKPEIDQP